VLNEHKNSFFESALRFFSENLDAVSEEQGVRFHQDIKEMERRYQGRWTVNMMGDYCWKFRKPHIRGRAIYAASPARKKTVQGH
jgi:hypothetical protein